MTIEWAPYALRDRIAIFDYIEADNPRVALAIDERIRSRVEILSQFPEMGRIGRIEGTRELVISNTLTSLRTASPRAPSASSEYSMAHNHGLTTCQRNYPISDDLGYRVCRFRTIPA